MCFSCSIEVHEKIFDTLIEKHLFY
ncbi:MULTISPECIES: hypothetical protein [Klebsiella/Raoultella group]|nr:hypothetical protein [Klebsiella quasipneumoniae]ELB7348490.1 hypothetical protein [Klebsiella michiganensis]MBQ5102918.1 hypothetical protein [Klebsiella pneumoniae]MCF6707907.1 hypothetical protein [Raoultella ornithinolytica]PXL40780.1 hypothetical protein DMS60_11615 [Klebsiella variicola]HCE8849374.1 hypothetical protein [Klebsiella oxytoca]HCI6378454.1 hypothetical protein [Klebsiella quasipneumoniae subsp. similipneumoniae]HCU5163731.1 hypothetical protein [Escherichia coli]